MKNFDSSFRSDLISSCDNEQWKGQCMRYSLPLWRTVALLCSKCSHKSISKAIKPVSQSQHYSNNIYWPKFWCQQDCAISRMNICWPRKFTKRFCVKLSDEQLLFSPAELRWGLKKLCYITKHLVLCTNKLYNARDLHTYLKGIVKLKLLARRKWTS